MQEQSGSKHVYTTDQLDYRHMGMKSVGKIEQHGYNIRVLCVCMVKHIAVLTVCYTQHDGKQMAQRGLSENYNDQEKFQEKSTGSDCHLAADTLKTAVTCTSSTMSLKLRQRTYC